MLYGTDGHCEDAWSDTACITFRGGAYDLDSSTSDTNVSAESHPVDSRNITVPQYPEMDFVGDSLTINENITLLDFPLAMAKDNWGEQGYYPHMAIGLGANSTLLNVLKNSGKILSRSWSFFYGIVSGSNQVNGQLVLGGYDASRVSGDSSEHTMSPVSSPCPTKLVVTVQGMALRFPNGTETNIFGASQSSALAVCLIPNIPMVMRMPLTPYFNNFMTATDNSIYSMDRSTGLYYWNLRYPADIPPLVHEDPCSLPFSLVSNTNHL